MRSLIGAAAVSLALMSSSALAGTALTDFDVQLTIADSCSVTLDATNVDFGTYDDLTSASTSVTTGSTSFKLKCTDGASNIKIEIDDGENYDSTNTIRRMKNTGADEYVSYKICQDANCTDLWGADPDHVSIIGTGSAETLTAYLKVPDQATTPSNGTYEDHVNINITF